MPSSQASIDLNDRVDALFPTGGFRRGVDNARPGLDLNCRVGAPLTTSGFHRSVERAELASEHQLELQG